MVPLTDAIRITSIGMTPSAISVMVTSILIITMNMPTSRIEDARIWKMPFIVMVWIAKVSYTMRTIRSPISRRR